MQPDQAWQTLPPTVKKSLLRVARKAREYRVSIDHIWADYRRHHPENFLPKSYKLALYAYLQALKEGNRRDQYQQEVSRLLWKFGNWWGLERSIDQLSPASIGSYFESYKSKVTHKADLTRIKCFLEWARRRKYLPSNPAQLIPFPRTDQKIPVVLSNDDVRKILQNVPDKEHSNFLVLSLYAGMRTTEIRKLKPDNFRGTNILLGGDSTKTRMNRTIELGSEVMRHINFDHPFSPRKIYEVPNYVRSMGCTYTQNVLRHTGATHMVQRLQSLDAAAYQLGTSVSMLAKHYKGMSTPETTKEFMELLSCIGQLPDSLVVRL